MVEDSEPLKISLTRRWRRETVFRRMADKFGQSLRERKRVKEKGGRSEEVTRCIIYYAARHDKLDRTVTRKNDTTRAAS